MSSERLMILNMVSDRKLTVDEAALLLESIARLEINDPTASEENPQKTETFVEPDPNNDTDPETILPIEEAPISQALDSFEEQSNPKRNVWKSLKRYIQRFRHPHPS